MKMKKIAIMQPTYLPWIGYFALMDSIDIFVYLDSVQFDKRSWQQRNKIKTPNGAQWLSVPVFTKSLSSQLISKVRIDYSQHFPEKHLKTIELAYKKAMYYDTLFDELIAIINRRYDKLCDLNIALIDLLKSKLGITTKCIKSSSLKTEYKKAELLADICENLSADTYISPIGSRDYMKKSKAFLSRNIKVLYNNYVHPRYSQMHGNFIEYLSCIDLLFNKGPKSLEIIRSGINLIE
jgi:hypothetical protein